MRSDPSLFTRKAGQHRLIVAIKTDEVLPSATDKNVVQYRALQGGWKKKKLSGNDKLSGLGDTRVNNCTVLIVNYLILFS